MSADTVMQEQKYGNDMQSHIDFAMPTSRCGSEMATCLVLTISAPPVEAVGDLVRSAVAATLDWYQSVDSRLSFLGFCCCYVDSRLGDSDGTALITSAEKLWGCGNQVVSQIKTAPSYSNALCEGARIPFDLIRDRSGLNTKPWQLEETSLRTNREEADCCLQSSCVHSVHQQPLGQKDFGVALHLDLSDDSVGPDLFCMISDERSAFAVGQHLNCRHDENMSFVDPATGRMGHEDQRSHADRDGLPNTCSRNVLGSVKANSLQLVSLGVVEDSALLREVNQWI